MAEPLRSGLVVVVPSGRRGVMLPDLSEMLLEG